MTSKQKAKFRGTSKWKDWRIYLIKKKKYHCDMCGCIRRVGLQVHHLVPSLYTTLKEENYNLLCPRCHKLLEQLLSRKTFNIKEFADNLIAIYNTTKKGNI